MIKPRTKQEIITRLESLTYHQGYIYSLVLMLQKDLFTPLGEVPKINPYKQLSFQEFGFLIGLMVKKPINLTFTSKENTEKDIRLTRKLFDELHWAYNEPFGKRLAEKFKEGELKNPKESFEDIFKSGELMTEPIFYGDSGAYDFQLWEFAFQKYQEDKEWLSKKNVDIASLIKITQFLKFQAETKLAKLKKNKDFEKYCNQILDIFCFNLEKLTEFSKGEVKGFLNNFSVEAGKINPEYKVPGDYNIIESHPVIKITENKFFIPISFNLSRSINESPFYWMLNDEEYMDFALTNRGKAVVNVAFEFLKPIFGKKNVFRDVKVYKSINKLLTDIDLLVLFRNKAVIFQIKSKRLTTLSRMGDDKSLEDDFEKAIQGAYNQGLLSRKAVLTKGVQFITETGEEIKIDEAIDEGYIVCLTSDDYPGMLMQAKTYLKRAADDPFPLLINIFDLDILAFYLNDPFEFLYYLRQRIDLYDYFLASGEIDYLGWHLKKKLFKIPGYDKVGIDNSFASYIDENFPVLRGYHPALKKDIAKFGPDWSNRDFEKIIERLKLSTNPGFVDAIFELYDTAGDGADELVSFIKKTKEKAIKEGKNSDFSLIANDNKNGVSFIAQNPASTNLLPAIFNLSVARKYKTKADKWLGLSSNAESPDLVEVAVFNKQPWQSNPKLEALQSTMLKPGMFINLKKVGRNEKCPCGSGRKYKKCCLNKPTT